MTEDRPGTRAIRTQLERILGSRELAGEPHLQALLSFLVEETLAGRASRLDPATLGVEVLGREASFDGASDPMVHRQAERLRRALAAYHISEGLGSPVRIDIPPGRFVPEFRSRGALARSSLGLAAGAAPRMARVAPADGPRIAVLPFRTPPGRTRSAPLGTGLAAEVGLRLTRYADMRVIAIRSAYPHRSDGPPDIRRIGAELEARYVLSGALDWNDERVGIAARLHDTHGPALLWADSLALAGDPADVHAAVERIAAAVAARVAMALGRRLVRLDAACLGAPPGTLQAYEALLRYRHHRCEAPLADTAALHADLEGAVAADPAFGTGAALLSELLVERVADAEPAEARIGLDRAFRLAGRAVALDPASQQVRWNLAYVHWHRHERAAAVEEAERTVAANPHDPNLCGAAGWALALLGRWERGLALLALHHRLNPRHPGEWHSAWYLDRYRQGDFEGALAYGRLYDGPWRFWGPLFRCAALAQLGRQHEARDEAGRLLSLRPDFQTRGRELIRREVFVEALDERLIAGLRKAGVGVD